MLKRCLFLTLVLASCAKAKDPVETVTPTSSDRAQYDQASGRLITGHVYGGFGVVSLKPDGAPEHMGEALIWGGTALWVLSCEKGSGIASALARMIIEGDGAIVRVQPLGEYAGGREVTVDGLLGALLGISRRVADCGEADLWREPVRLLTAYQDAHGGRLHPNVTASAEIFTAVRDLIASRLGLRGQPAADRFRQLEKTIGGWAAAVLVAHKTGHGSDACYRINLGLTAYLTDETLGVNVSQAGRDQFCAATPSMDIPTVDHWCGRQSVVGYLNNYEPDVWEYRHQRCGAWESPDGDGNKSPELDRLVALVMAHGWHSLQ